MANPARHKMPRDVVFLDALPRDATGKLPRHTLEQHETTADQCDTPN